MADRLRQDGYVPRYITPPDMPPEVEAIIDVVGSRVRLGILRELAQHGPLTTSELMHRTTASETSANDHLRALEDAGLITADIPRGQRRGKGRAPHWSLIPEAVNTYVEQLREYLLHEK